MTVRPGSGWRAFRLLDYPDFDLCAPVTDPERFDVVVREQVLEHVIDPYLAVENLFELCRPGGHAVRSSRHRS